MRPVAVRLPIPFFGCGGVRSMRRGGNHSARRNTAALDVAGAARCLFCIVGRGLDLRPKGRRCAAVGLRNAPAGADPAAHWFGGRERPPYRAQETGNEPGTPRGTHPCREACMPPLQIRVPRTRTQNVATRQTPAGRMHAAPTDRPGTTYKWVRQAFTADRPACECGRGFRTGARMSLAGSRGFQRGPQAPLAVPRASELAAGFSLPFCPVKKEDIRRVKRPNLIDHAEGFASLPKNVITGQTSAAGSRPRPTDHPGTTNKQVKQTATAGVNAHPAERRGRPVQWGGRHGRI